MVLAQLGHKALGGITFTIIFGRAISLGFPSRRTKNNALLVDGQTVEENEGLRPHISWMETLDFSHV